MDDFVDIAEVSARLGGFAPRDLVRACERGEIPARHIGSDWLVQRNWLTELEARLSTTVLQAIASESSARPATEARGQSLEERRQRKAASHFMRRIAQQLAELRAEIARIDNRLASLDLRTLHIAQRQIRYHDHSSPAADGAAAPLRKPPTNAENSRLD